MNKKGDFDFEWLPGFREMMACQNEEQNTQQETDWGNENLQIEALLPPEQLQQGRSKFIKTMIFGKEIKVVRIDKATMDYYIRLTNFYHQFQSIGNNYNQTVKAVKTNFGEKRAFVLLRNLEKATIDLVLLSKRIIMLTREFEENYLIKQRKEEEKWWLKSTEVLRSTVQSSTTSRK